MVKHSTTYQGFAIEIENFPGSRTLFWRIYCLANPAFFSMHNEDRCEGGVGRCKERALELVDDWAPKVEAKKNL